MTPEQAAEKFMKSLPIHPDRFYDGLWLELTEIIHAQRAEAVAEYLSSPIEQRKKDVVDAMFVELRVDGTCTGGASKK